MCNFLDSFVESNPSDANLEYMILTTCLVKWALMSWEENFQQTVRIVEIIFVFWEGRFDYYSKFLRGLPEVWAQTAKLLSLETENK